MMLIRPAGPLSTISFSVIHMWREPEIKRVRVCAVNRRVEMCALCSVRTLGSRANHISRKLQKLWLSPGHVKGKCQLDLAAATLSTDWLQMQHFLNGYLTQSKVSSLYISIMKICLYASMFFYQCAVPICVYVCRQQLDEQLTQWCSRYPCFGLALGTVKKLTLGGII